MLWSMGSRMAGADWSPWLVHPPPEAPALAGGLRAASLFPKILLCKETGDPAQRLRWFREPRKGPVSPESANTFQAGGPPCCSPPTGAVLWHVGGVFPERGGCCPGTEGAQPLVFPELPPFMPSPGDGLSRQPGWLSRATQAPAPKARGMPCCQLLPWGGLTGGDGAAQSPLRLSICLPDGLSPSVPMVEGRCKYLVAFLVFGAVSGRLENEKRHTWVDSSGL